MGQCRELKYLQLFFVDGVPEGDDHWVCPRLHEVSILVLVDVSLEG
jgi:hypothetical protein